ncbi:MAG: hypothetical protein KatS3mg035_1864 [Bacteroidia bacterium]|nr:MAG: hypothetical protein KatS3mg035_1864 [Bacteroidia bacterium]
MIYLLSKGKKNSQYNDAALNDQSFSLLSPKNLSL